MIILRMITGVMTEVPPKDPNVIYSLRVLLGKATPPLLVPCLVEQLVCGGARPADRLWENKDRSSHRRKGRKRSISWMNGN